MNSNIIGTLFLLNNYNKQHEKIIEECSTKKTEDVPQEKVELTPESLKTFINIVKVMSEQ